MLQIDNLLKQMIQMKASDLHLKRGSTAIVRVNRELIPIGSEILTQEVMESFLKELLNEAQLSKFKKDFEIDLAFTAPAIGRFRTNIFF